MSNPFISYNASKAHELIPGFTGKFIHGDKMTIIYWSIKAGSVLPEHHHEHEQIVTVYQGEFELTIDGVTQTLKPGMVAVIPSNAVHSGRAITDCELTDVFSPIREDYKFD